MITLSKLFEAVNLLAKKVGCTEEMEALFAETTFLSPFAPVDDLELTVRSTVCLKNNGIMLIYQLCRKTEADIVEMENLGRKSFNEIKDKLKEHGLRLGMTEEEMLRWTVNMMFEANRRLNE